MSEGREISLDGLVTAVGPRGAITVRSAGQHIDVNASNLASLLDASRAARPLRSALASRSLTPSTLRLQDLRADLRIRGWRVASLQTGGRRTLAARALGSPVNGLRLRIPTRSSGRA